MILFIVPTVIFFVFYFFAVFFIQGVASGMGPLISVYGWSISLQIPRPILFFAFEKKEDMRIMQSWWGMGFVLMPKPPVGTPIQGGLKA